MKTLILQHLKNVHFSDRYIKICNEYSQYENGKDFKKNDFNDIGDDRIAKFTYMAKDKSFYQDYLFGKFNARFTFSFKYGFIECFYSFWQDNGAERIDGRFNSIAKLIDNDFESKVKHKFPIATSSEDLKAILTVLLDLNTEVMNTFS